MFAVLLQFDCINYESRRA